jgi:hypothetical protein
MTHSSRSGQPAKSEPCLSLTGWGTAQADLPSIAGMRKSLPDWAPKGTPGHFLKHADEQTVLAVAAVDQAIRSSAMDPAEFRDWTIIAAPRFIGRLAGTSTLDRFSRGGGPAISPHVIPQHSLHSISGALSILLASHRPNFGVGGTADSLAEGLLASLTIPADGCTKTWLVSTAWDPEPQIDNAGQCTNSPVCHAVALALQSAAQSHNCGRLRLMLQSGPIENRRALCWYENAASLCQGLAALAPGGPAGCFAWRLSWGATLVLEVCEALSTLPAAA